MSTANPAGPQGTLLKAYEEKITAQVQEAKAKLEEFEARAREQKAQGEIDAIGKLKVAKQNIDRKLQELKTTQETHVARAKAEVDTEVVRFKTAVEELGAKLKAHATTK